MALKTMQFVAIVLAALALIPAGAHFFELPHKIGMAQEQYFTVQSIYRGWALFGIPMIGAIVVTAILAIILMQWEYSHAANAVLGLIGFCTLAVSILTTRR